jgi:Domain of unknown function (DUF4288)
MWHSVQALFRCDVQAETDNVLYEKKIFLIYVDPEQIVSEKAEKAAKAFEHQYKNSEGGDVVWVYAKILEIQDIIEKEPGDGVEVFSRLLWEHELSGDL